MALSTQPHFTLPECPNCQAPQKAVAHWTSADEADWICFECKATGTVDMSYIVFDPKGPGA